MSQAELERDFRLRVPKFGIFETPESDKTSVETLGTDSDTHKVERFDSNLE